MNISHRNLCLVWIALVNCIGALSAADNLTFVPEAGTRLETAAIPEAGIDSSGKTYLYYQDAFPGGKDKVSISTDGLTFPVGSTYTTYANDSRNTRLPDGTYRRYTAPQPGTNNFTSQTSTDGVNFTPQAATVYTLVAADNSSSGVYEAYAQSNGNVVLLYLGDLHGLNNTRMARSTDGGKTFSFVRGNVLGDDSSGGGGNSFVDITSLKLPDGRRRLFAMKGGNAIYSFISTDDGETYTQEPGARVSRTDFKEFNVTGLFDPVVVRLTDGSYRMYVCAQVLNADGSTSSKIVSALASTTGSSSGITISSPASATPSQVSIGADVSFSTSASDASGGALTYTWTFGDGSAGSGSNVTHAYVSAGTFTATCTVTNAAGSSATTQVSVTVDTSSDGALQISKLNIKLNFSRDNSDTLMLSATAQLPAGFTPDQQRLLINVGGVVRSFVLNARGGGVSSESGADTVMLRTRKGSSLAMVTVKLSRGAFLADFADEGLLNATVYAQSATIGVALVIGTAAYHADAAVTYTAHLGKMGSAKK